MSPVLKLKRDNEKKELEFELKYQLSLSFEERFRMMLRRSREILEMLIAYGYRKPTEIIKRK